MNMKDEHEDGFEMRNWDGNFERNEFGKLLSLKWTESKKGKEKNDPAFLQMEKKSKKETYWKGKNYSYIRLGNSDETNAWNSN